MSYIQDNLGSNEKILFSARVSPAVFLPAVVVFVFSVVLSIWGLSSMPQTPTSSPVPPLAVGPSVFGTTFLCLSLFLFVWSIVLGVQALITILTTEFGITNHRVIAKVGFIRRHTLEILLPKIESIAVNQNILARLLDFGTITVTGTGGTKESFRAIISPIVVRKYINQIIEHYSPAYVQQQRYASAGPAA